MEAEFECCGEVIRAGAYMPSFWMYDTFPAAYFESSVEMQKSFVMSPDLAMSDPC